MISKPMINIAYVPFIDYHRVYACLFTVKCIKTLSWSDRTLEHHFVVSHVLVNLSSFSFFSLSSNRTKIDPALSRWRRWKMYRRCGVRSSIRTGASTRSAPTRRRSGSANTRPCRRLGKRICSEWTRCCHFSPIFVCMLFCSILNTPIPMLETLRQYSRITSHHIQHTQARPETLHFHQSIFHFRFFFLLSKCRHVNAPSVTCVRPCLRTLHHCTTPRTLFGGRKALSNSINEWYCLPRWRV